MTDKRRHAMFVRRQLFGAPACRVGHVASVTAIRLHTARLTIRCGAHPPQAPRPCRECQPMTATACIRPDRCGHGFIRPGTSVAALRPPRPVTAKRRIQPPRRLSEDAEDGTSTEHEQRRHLLTNGPHRDEPAAGGCPAACPPTTMATRQPVPPCRGIPCCLHAVGLNHARSPLCRPGSRAARGSAPRSPLP